MAASIDVAIADAVVTVLAAAAAQFPDLTVIERRLLPIYTTGQLKTLRIAVAPRMQTRETASRGSSRREHTVQIAPHLMVPHVDGQVSESSLAAFLGHVETIADVIERAAFASTKFAEATFVRLATEPLYDLELTKSPGVMRAVITCHFLRLASPPTL